MMDAGLISPVWLLLLCSCACVPVCNDIVWCLCLFLCDISRSRVLRGPAKHAVQSMFCICSLPPLSSLVITTFFCAAN